VGKKKSPDDLSIRAYAKLRARADNAVRRAIASGRLVKSVEQRAGKWWIVDADLADREWAENARSGGRLMAGFWTELRLELLQRESAAGASVNGEAR
jgi:sulfur transfer complex TusBCD TusB component (DsrH family)